MDPSLILVLGLGALLIFMIMNTRRKQKEQQANLASNLVPGREVMTSAGLFGTVVEVDSENNKVVIEPTPGTRLVVHRQAISQITPVEEPAADEVAVDEADEAAAPDAGDAVEPAEPGTAAGENRPDEGPAGDEPTDSTDKK
ncbi:preprotein translocase subunit YajC [Sediminivirga luteola]|uniref:Preprotein translocase subunit YajC n=1 Tax=Sediminivirga luteola TaxID=1774748 RepID=A0A8J2TYN4_9MICO|nr:preprotein translocase subunit YajC [Sediminivirga luteola]MCI2264181.1 preprotein translocase subunit YajC [Sediminivirga luteola]GGA17545.1 hypothetical protein GCM10011333_20820 [Sediminivirga luteola]